MQVLGWVPRTTKTKIYQLLPMTGIAGFDCLPYRLKDDWSQGHHKVTLLPKEFRVWCVILKIISITENQVCPNPLDFSLLILES